MPDVALDPLHWVEPDAVQDVALVVDHEKVEVLLRRTEVGVAEKLIPGAGVGGVGASPPPPPPPQETTTKTRNKYDLYILKKGKFTFFSPQFYQELNLLSYGIINFF